MTSRARWLFAALSALCIVAGVITARALASHVVALTLGNQRVEALIPQSFAVLWVLPVLALAAQQSLTDMSGPQRALTLLLRSLLVVTLAAALARLVRVHESKLVSAVLAVDVSDSIDDQALARARDFVHEVAATRGDNDLHLVTFGARPRTVALPRDTSAEQVVARHAATNSDPTPLAGSDLQAAVQLAYGLFPSGHNRRVLLISDGNETRGDIASEAQRAQRLGIRIDTTWWTDAPPRELAASALDLPQPIELGKPFHMHARVFSTTAARARVKLYQDDVQNGLDGERELDLTPGENELDFNSIVRVPGKVSYRLELTPLTPDRFATNNSVSATATVAGRPRVLLIDREPERLTPVANALTQSDLEIELRTPLAMPRSAAEYERYDFVILSDVPNAALPPNTQDGLERYVRDFGGGFMMAGGDSSFGLGGYQGTRMERLLPVRMAAERKNEEQSLALALVIDCSGSMAGQKLDLAKEAARAAAEVLNDSDSLEVIGFSGQAERKVRLQSARNRVGIAQSIARLVAQGGTQIFPALDMAYQDLSAMRARIKHVILLTDGQSQESGIVELVQAMRGEAITVSTVGLGADVNKSLLQNAASLGGGRTYFTNDPETVPRIFVSETTSMKRDSAVEDLTSVQQREPADFLKGIDIAHAPLLRGYVATQAKARPAQVILESERGEPILARWHVGLGFALAWTTDLKARWATDWLRWPSFPTLLAQLVREHMRAPKSDELAMSVEVRDGAAHVTVDALGKDDRFLDGLDSELHNTSSGGAAVAFRQTGPGRYEATLPLPSFGAFALEAVHKRDGNVIARSHAQAQNPYPREYATLGPNAGLLRRVASLSRGLTQPSAAQVWQAGDDRVRTYEELWPALAGLALALFLVDLWLRRLRIFDENVD